MYAHTPPPPPPKPASRMSTPADNNNTQFARPPPPLPAETAGDDAEPPTQQQPTIPDPGDTWLPKILEDKSKQDLTTLLSTPSLLSSLTHAPQAIHPSLAASHAALAASLSANVERAAALLDAEARLARQREATHAQLLATHALERQWRAKQAEMDEALAGFAPARLYQRVSAGVTEQEGVCQAMEESFLDGDGEATEKEVADWVRRYREARKVYYERKERKERWDEGRVGGWR
ncbi:c30bbf30-9fbc-4e66-a2bf-10b1e4b0b4e2 [Podospora conica]|nr:c30bbf30-9fbc-4e66-a2bf-10b1e4b0b4e2 [Schizothecium conicum]